MIWPSLAGKKTLPRMPMPWVHPQQLKMPALGELLLGPSVVMYCSVFLSFSVSLSFHVYISRMICVMWSMCHACLIPPTDQHDMYVDMQPVNVDAKEEDGPCLGPYASSDLLNNRPDLRT